MSERCQLKTRWKICCCACKFHLRDRSHPTTDGKSIMHPRGWICSPPELEGAFSGFSKHGMCEMFVHEDFWELSEEAK